MFCSNSDCKHKTFSERHPFVAIKGKKTIRLENSILSRSLDVSSINASKLLASEGVAVSKSSICAMLKKMRGIVDKSRVFNICVDDFAIRKRFSYGTIMVDLDTHRIIDLLPSRETQDVQEWLKTYPNIRIISRDGAMTYSSAASQAHPEAVQISDRFHLLKTLSESIQKYIIREFPSRIEIPAEKEIPEEMKALYDTSNK